MDVTYDTSHISLERIQEIVERLHYQVLSTKTESDKSKLWKNYLETAAILLLLLLAYLLIDQTVGFTFVPQLDQSIGMLSLFIIGLFTSLHCVAMCGGITLSICMGGVGAVFSLSYAGKATIQMIAGISMIQRSLIFTEGTKNLQAAEIVEEKETEVLVEETQEIESTISSRDYEDITVKAGIPVKWTIVADKEDINGCNNVLVIPAYHIQLQILPGENVIEFTPEEEGVIGYSCWMGMIRNSITVVKN